jgi:HAD superfamily hydrolase (TIGR01509 family)
MPIFTAPTKDYDGYIFDCDGTLADSMPMHYRAWREAVTEFGSKISEELFYSLGGVPTTKIVELLNERDGTTMDPVVVATRKENLYLGLIAGIEPIAEVVEFAQKVKRRAKVAVASGGELPVVRRTLAAIGLEGFFPVIVSSEQVDRGKPFPDMFLEAAKRMEVRPERCLVLEDSEAGFQAATAAGMDYVVVSRPQRSLPANESVLPAIGQNSDKP